MRYIALVLIILALSGCQTIPSKTTSVNPKIIPYPFTTEPITYDPIIDEDAAKNTKWICGTPLPRWNNDSFRE